MNRRAFTLLVLFFLCWTAACSSGGSKLESALLGQWELTDSNGASHDLAANLEFLEDGTLVVEQSWLREAATFEYGIVAPGVMKITSEDVSDSLQYKIEDDTLSIRYQGVVTQYRHLTTPIPEQSNTSQSVTEVTPTQPKYFWEKTEPPTQPTIAENIPTQTPTATATLVMPTNSCYSSSLKIYGSAFVIKTGNEMKLRDSAGFKNTAGLTGQLQVGEVVLLVNGPKCVDNWRFWEILTTRNERGWIPESDGTTPWLEAIDTYQACPNTVLSRLKVGDIAFVQEIPDLPNRVRVEPKVDSEIVARIYPLGEMEILEGPLCGEGGVWWKVKSMKSGRIGWTMESRNGEYYIAPRP